MATVSCLGTKILQNIFFCVQQKNETHTGLERVNDDRIYFLGGKTILLIW